jgi:hypothetical protein
MDKQNAKKYAQLGEPQGTAANRLRKMILFSLLVEVGRDACYRCEQKIERVEELSVEHKAAWLDSPDPKGLFFDLKNIAFSHLRCNIGAARKPNKYPTEEIRRQKALESFRRGSNKYCTPARRRQKYLEHGY